MQGTPMLALRSVLLLDALNEAALAAAKRSAADAVAIDLAGPALHGRRDEARAAAVKAAQAIAETDRPVFARLSDTRSGELEADIEAVTGPWLTAVILAGAEVPQDVRDADVQIRKREMRRSIRPGTVRLLPEIDSAEGLLAVERTLAAVDRHSGIVLNLDGLRDDLRLGERATALFGHAMADLAMTAHATRMPWLVSATFGRPDATAFATTAHEYGAAGAVLRDEAAVRGMNALFAPGNDEVEAARATIGEWERLRGNGARSSVIDGALVDVRTVRRARALLAQLDAIERRERVR
jgi:citrate lyase subunit beta / citryl-CoA lyase